MKCIIIDDDVSFSMTLSSYVENYLKKLFPKYEIDVVNKDFLTVPNLKDYSLIFLDIDLQTMNGINIAKMIRNTDTNYQQVIVFVSSRNELVFDSFSVRPFYFLRKSSLDYDIDTLFTLLTDFYNNTMKLITINYYGRKTAILQKDILYILSYGHDITVVTTDEEYIYRSTMKEALELLGTNFIIQIQKSVAISVAQIREIIGNQVYLKNGLSFTVGRKFKAPLLLSYKEYLIQ